MKKRILTLLLTGLLVMSAVACNTPTENPNLTGSTDGGEVTTPIETDSDGYQVVNETVYSLVDELNLRSEASTSGEAAKKVDFATEMTRVKYGSTWSVVQYNGTEYFVKSDYITTDDLGLKTFTALSTEKVVHATTAGVNVRKYPTTNSLVTDNSFKKLTLNETVTVVAENDDWYQIKLDGKKYYVSKQYFEDGEVPSINDLGDYNAKFELGALDTPVVMYVIGNGTRVRTLPSTEDYSEVITSYSMDTPVTVVAVAKINGYKWAKVKAQTDPDDPASSTIDGYIRYDLLGLVKAVDNTKLESVLAAFNFTEFDEDETMYVAKDGGGLRIRKTPIVQTGDETNEYGSLSAEEEVTVVAYGVGDYEDWYLIKYKDEGYYFVAKAYIVSEKGAMSSLKADSYQNYDAFTAYTGTAEKTIKDGGAYRYITPVLSDANKSGDALEAGVTVTVIAEGVYQNSTYNYAVYFIKDANGNYWFIDQNRVN